MKGQAVVRQSSISKSSKLKKAKKKKSVQLNEADIHALIIDHRENARKLARSFLRRWRVRMSAEEIDSIVDLTLCEAGKRFRPDKGASFMTFLYYHLRGQFVRAVESAASNQSMMVNFSQISGMDVGDWMPSPDALVSADVSLFRHQEVDSPEQLLLRKENVEVCRKAYTVLDDLEKEIINRSFDDEEALVAIARSLGYSRCHISRVKKRALERMKGALEKNFEDHSRANTIRPLDREITRRTRRRTRRYRPEILKEAA